jgi:RNA polymerase sigma-70 factor, ECF subfamily
MISVQRAGVIPSVIHFAIRAQRCAPVYTGEIPKRLTNLMPPSPAIEEHIPRLRRYARALTSNREAADDLVQDALERAWKKQHLWQADTDLRAWLFSIMHNVHVNQVKSRHNQALEALEDEALELPVRATQQDGLMVRDLERSLRRLPDEQREVLLLAGLEQMSYQEIAQVLSIPLGTVMSRLARGREKLRALMYGLPSAPTLGVVK